MHPLPVLHRDLFDRLLIAQAIEESLVLVTGDELLSRYAVRTLQGRSGSLTPPRSP